MKQRKPNRLQCFDYSNPWWYYATICTQDHKIHFGKVVKTKMILNDCGRTAEQLWLEIPEHYPHVELDEFVIMPNHIHGIIIINNTVGIEYFQSQKDNMNDDNHSLNIGNDNNRSLRKTNLSNVIKGFKIGVTKWCNQNNCNNFKWQKSFYDRIIRNERELYHIRKYILQNPLNWELEKNIDNLEI